MEAWRLELTARGKSIAEEQIQRGIFPGDSLAHFDSDDATQPHTPE